ncbi:MAG TPA: ferrochelatase [Thermopetrobacter sp.]|nr:ferrochelatase [Thermopetrobacter sp.]
MSDVRPALVLVNLGSPDAPTAAAVRRYLRQFLSDRRVVEIPRAVWWPLLHGVILPLRAPRTAAKYRAIWNHETGRSPLLEITARQAAALQERLSDAARVAWAMRYGTPAIDAVLRELTAAGHRRIAVLPLYPQYSATTTASVADAVAAALSAMRHQPAVRLGAPYHDHPAYIAALAQGVRDHVAGLDWRPEVLLASYHGLPRAFVKRGDPYEAHCEETTRLLRQALPEVDIRLSYQSRLGRGEWLTPYTEEVLKALAAEGVKNVSVITPAFAADCLETLEEIGLEAAETFRAAGGENFSVAPCLNDSAPGVALLEELARRELAGWI